MTKKLFKQFQEEYLTRIKGYSGTSYEVFKDPSRSEIQSVLDPSKFLRFIIDFGSPSSPKQTLYVFDLNLLHNYVRKNLKLTWCFLGSGVYENGKIKVIGGTTEAGNGKPPKYFPDDDIIYADKETVTASKVKQKVIDQYKFLSMNYLIDGKEYLDKTITTTLRFMKKT